MILNKYVGGNAHNIWVMHHGRRAGVQLAVEGGVVGGGGGKERPTASIVHQTDKGKIKQPSLSSPALLSCLRFSDIAGKGR